MLDAKLLRNNPDFVNKSLKNRHADMALVNSFVALDEQWRKLNAQTDNLKALRNKVSDDIAKLKQEKKDASSLIDEMKQVSNQIKDLDAQLAAKDQEVSAVLLNLPNLAHASVPIGMDSRDNLEVRAWGDKPGFDFTPKSHEVIGEALGILNFKEAAKISGSRFVVYHGLGAKLERALINFMLDVHTKENGYQEVIAPVLVNPRSMLGTGQLPKFEEDLFKLRDDDLYLIPTAEVSVTNLHSDEILAKEQLPIKYACYSVCFRREAGSYGKDVKGIIRQHQFNKVELVKFVEPDQSYAELEKLTNDAEKILQKLGLPYRVVMLCSGDLGFSSAKTYDLEAWFPSENKYREISSCSNFEAFQARRANIKYKTEPKAKAEYVHTLNGSGLAVGRTVAAILENYQQKDGSVKIPQALQSYVGAEVIK